MPALRSSRLPAAASAVGAATTAVLLATAGPLAGQERLQACFAERLATFQATTTEPFTVEGEVLCPAAEPIPQDRETVLTYRAPPGALIDPGSLTVRVRDSRNGRNESPIVSGQTLQLRLLCEGLEAGAVGQARHAVTVTGTLVRGISPESVAEIEADCRGQSPTPR
jgi:hypothetical protein